MALAAGADEDGRTAEEYPGDHRTHAYPSPEGYDRERDSRTTSRRRTPSASAVLDNALRNDFGSGTRLSMHMGQEAPQTCGSTDVIRSVTGSGFPEAKTIFR